MCVARGLTHLAKCAHRRGRVLCAHAAAPFRHSKRKCDRLTLLPHALDTSSSSSCTCTFAESLGAECRGPCIIIVSFLPSSLFHVLVAAHVRGSLCVLCSARVRVCGLARTHTHTCAHTHAYAHTRRHFCVPLHLCQYAGMLYVEISLGAICGDTQSCHTNFR